VGRTILVADDSPTIQKKASGILTGEGLDVITVSNGVAAVKKLPTVNPLVVLADVSMPGKDGYEVCEHIKSSSEFSNVFVILIFSDTDPYEEAKGTRVNADGRIKKPFDRDELIGIVTKFVAEAEAAAQKAAAPPPPPPTEYELEPIEPEQPEQQPSPASDLVAVSEGVAFGVPAGEEISAIPPEPMVSEPVTAEPTAAPEEPHVFPGADSESAGELPSLVKEPEPPVVIEPEAEPSTAELVAETPIEAQPSEQSPEPAEPLLVEEEAVPAAPPEESAERTMMFRAPGDIAQPVFSDELEPSAPVAEPAEASPGEPPLAVVHAPEPSAVETTPEPEPMPASELEAKPEAVSEREPAPAGEAMAYETPPEGTPIPPATLESYTLGDAAAGQVRFAPSEAEPATEPQPELAPEPVEEAVDQATEAAEPAPEPVAEASEAEAPPPEPVGSPAGPSAPALDPEQVFSIVHKVVVKMSPPALSPQMIEDIARRFADEIVAELRSES
jgi:CheY-like chemotaxis protein